MHAILVTRTLEGGRHNTATQQQQFEVQRDGLPFAQSSSASHTTARTAAVDYSVYHTPDARVFGYSTIKSSTSTKTVLLRKVLIFQSIRDLGPAQHRAKRTTVQQRGRTFGGYAATEQNLPCPSRITQQQVPLKHPVTGWAEHLGSVPAVGMLALRKKGNKCRDRTDQDPRDSNSQATPPVVSIAPIPPGYLSSLS